MKHIQQQSGDGGQIFLSPNTKFRKVRPVEAVSVHADRRTDSHDEENGAFLDYAKAPKVVWFVT